MTFPGIVTSSVEQAKDKVQKCKDALRKAEELLRVEEEKQRVINSGMVRTRPYRV